MADRCRCAVRQRRGRLVIDELEPPRLFASSDRGWITRHCTEGLRLSERTHESCGVRCVCHFQYVDFWRVTEDALVFAGKMLDLDVTTNQRVRLMDAYLEIRCWQEAPAALRSLKDKGIRLAFLSNMTRQMLEAGIHNSGLEQLFDEVLSTDRVSAFKPIRVPLKWASMR
jgi:2-haloalkanoic acid dehalogenase type II